MGNWQERGKWLQEPEVMSDRNRRAAPEVLGPALRLLFLPPDNVAYLPPFPCQCVYSSTDYEFVHINKEALS